MTGKPAEPESLVFGDDGRFPNSRLPLLLYRAALPADAAEMDRVFAANGWSNSWRNGIFPYHHFHSIAHEVLGVAGGSASVVFGGPGGRVVRIGAGDVVVIPAGVGHCRQESSADFLVVGAYPGGADWDIRRGDPAERETVLRNLAAVPVPATDPVHGASRGLPDRWKG